ncbi:MAG TPA: zf-HC2 domain-containing protein [Candidatus Saccharimonadales bacterium]|jgi:hypothetical protein|nr:zf-HC2 domain-containing protein [Candidatus Saccharimonadales bacterium]
MMDHNLVIENMTTERYLLGELTEAERDAYEEHYFGCSECAEELTSGSEFMHYAREVVLQDTAREAVVQGQTKQIRPGVFSRPVWMRAMPVGAFAVLMLAAGIGLYHRSPGGSQDQVTAQLEPPALHAHLEQSRSASGENLTVIKLGRKQPLVLTFRIRSADKSPEFVSYEAAIATKSGDKRVHNISDQELGDMIEWTIPAGDLESGSHAVMIRGFRRDGAPTDVIDATKGKALSFPFKLELQGD